MTRAFFILAFAVITFCSGCRTYSPDVQAMWRQYGMVKRGMTQSEVYAIVPSTGRFRIADGREMESWCFAPHAIVGDHAHLSVIYGTNGRVDSASRYREDGHDDCFLRAAVPPH